MLTMSDKELVKLGGEVIGPLSYGEFNLMKLVQDKLVELNTVEKKLTTQPLSDDEIDRLRRTDLINVDCGYAAGLRLARLMEKAHGIGKENE